MQNQFRILLCCAFGAAVGGAIAAPSSARAQANNAVLEQLWKPGVPMEQNNRVLPPLTMADGLNAAGQKAVVQKILALKLLARGQFRSVHD